MFTVASIEKELNNLPAGVSGSFLLRMRYKFLTGKSFVPEVSKTSKPKK